MKIRPLVAELFNAGGQTGRRDETSLADEPRTKLLKKYLTLIVPKSSEMAYTVMLRNKT